VSFTVLVPYPKWCDLPNKKYAITRAEFRPIANAATRLAALISGEVDLAYPVAPQDVARVEGQKGFRVVKRPELRVVFLGAGAAEGASRTLADSSPFGNRERPDV
jgi:peptide/nickel transport system substrate-binding protein